MKVVKTPIRTRTEVLAAFVPWRPRLAAIRTRSARSVAFTALFNFTPIYFHPYLFTRARPSILRRDESASGRTAAAVPVLKHSRSRPCEYPSRALELVAQRCGDTFLGELLAHDRDLHVGHVAGLVLVARADGFSWRTTCHATPKPQVLAGCSSALLHCWNHSRQPKLVTVDASRRFGGSKSLLLTYMTIELL